MLGSECKAYTPAYTDGVLGITSSPYHTYIRRFSMATYTIIQKNKGAKGHPRPKWYIRERESGRYRDIRLDTEDRSVAEEELMRIRLAAAEISRSGGTGDPADALAIRRKGPSQGVLSPVGILDRWMDEMRLEGLREGTVERYGRCARFLLGKFPDLTPESVRAAMASTAPRKANTRRACGNALRSLFRHMGRRDLEDAVPHVKSDPGPDRRCWTREEMAEIVMTASSDTAERTLQYREYFGMMAAIGSRDSETRALRWEDVGEDGTVTFRSSVTKSRRTRVVPIPVSLHASLELRRGAPGDEVFPLVGSCQATRYNVLKRALRKLGLEGGLHGFRRGVSEELYGKCRDIRSVAQLLGHSGSVAMEHYSRRRTAEELRELVERD